MNKKKIIGICIILLCVVAIFVIVRQYKSTKQDNQQRQIISSTYDGAITEESNWDIAPELGRFVVRDNTTGESKYGFKFARTDEVLEHMLEVEEANDYLIIDKNVEESFASYTIQYFSNNQDPDYSIYYIVEDDEKSVCEKENSLSVTDILQNLEDVKSRSEQLDAEMSTEVNYE